VEAAGEEDKLFIIFYHLSKYQAVADLWAGIANIETLPEETNDWLCFPQAKPQIKGGDGRPLYSLVDWLSQPFSKFIKKLSLWCNENKFGLWQSALQPEKPVSLGWLIFSTNTMDTKALQQSFTKSIQDVRVGLWWKMICLGVQGQVKLEDQVRVLHIYTNGFAIAKPLLMNLYPSKPSEIHEFALHFWPCLVPELDTVLNIKGCKKIEKLCACQNTWNTKNWTFGY